MAESRSAPWAACPASSAGRSRPGSRSSRCGGRPRRGARGRSGRARHVPRARAGFRPGTPRTRAVSADSARERAALPTIPARVASVRRAATAPSWPPRRAQGKDQEDRKGQDSSSQTRWARCRAPGRAPRRARCSRRRWGRIPASVSALARVTTAATGTRWVRTNATGAVASKPSRRAKVGGPSSASRDPRRGRVRRPAAHAPAVTWIRASRASTTAPVTGSSEAPVSRRPTASARLRAGVA